MVKRKRKSMVARFVQKLNIRRKESEDARLQLLAKEISIAGIVVLVNDFEFTTEQAEKWLTLTIDQAKITRTMIESKMAYESVKGPMEDITT